MKVLLATVLLLIAFSTCSAQFNQNNRRLSDYLKTAFPYLSVGKDNCDSLFVGVFYVRFQIGKNGKCDNVNFYGVEDTLLISTFRKLLHQDSVVFDKSFRRKALGKAIIQSVFFSDYNCARENIINEEGLSDECNLCKQALLVSSRIRDKMSRSIGNGFPFVGAEGFFEGVVLSPCVIDVWPEYLNRRTM
jgi:hypothetical protein